MIFQELAFVCNLTIPSKDLNNRLIHQRSLVATCLMKFFLHQKTAKDHGYFRTVTSLKCIGKGKPLGPPGFILIPVTFSCHTFMPCPGETMLGVVHRVHEHGAFLRCGPIRYVYLSRVKMADYHNFVPGKNAAFLNDSFSRIEVGVVVRFMVLDARWKELNGRARMEFMVLATLEGRGL